MKSILRVVLMVGFVLIMCIPTSVAADEAKVLSEMTDAECMAFLEQYDVEIPDIYENKTDALPFVRSIIAQREANRDSNIPCIEPKLTQFRSAIRDAVNDYYNLGEIVSYIVSPSGDIIIDTENILEENDTHGGWSNNYLTYNCYGYAIEDYKWLKPGYEEWLSQGEELVDYEFDDSKNISEIANLVKEDLERKGYTVQEPTTIMPSTTITAHRFLICVRKDLDSMPYADQYGNTVYYKDFHFMRLDSDGWWYHKPGGTNPLRYLSTPNYSLEWVHEVYDGTVYIRYLDYTYDSEIYYIEYVTPHNYVYTSNSVGTHTKTCTICSNTVQESCNLTYSYIGDSMHNAYCGDCGYGLNGLYCSYEYQSNSDGTHTKTCTACNASEVVSCDLYTEYSGSGAHATRCTYCDRLSFASCTGVLTHYEDETLGDAHKLECRDCGNDMGGTGEACTIDYVFVGTIDGVNHHARFCTECDYRKTANFSCVYVNSDYCRFCGTHKDRLQAVALHLQFP